MRFFCPGCGTKYSKQDDEIPDAGLTIPCESCGFSISLKPPSRKTSSSGIRRTSKARKSEPPTVAPRERGKEDATEKIDTVDPSEVEEVQVPQPSGEEPPTQAVTAPAEPAKEKKPRTRKAGKGWGTAVDSLGTGRSGDAFRFRDLFFAIVVPLDLRKLLVVGAAILVGSCLMTGLGYLGVVAKSQVVATIGLILGAVIFAALNFLALGITSSLTDQEMEAGKHLPLSVGTKFLKQNLQTVLGTPFFFLLGIVAMGVGIAVLGLIGRIPYAGPILFGLTFLATFALAFLSVVVAILLFLVVFSYVPAAAREGLGPWAAAKRMLDLLRRQPGRYLLHALLATGCAIVLYVVLSFLVGLAMTHLVWIDAKALGADLTSVFMGVPLGLFAVAVLVVPEPMTALFSAAVDVGWQFDLAGVFVLIGLLVVGSLVAAFVQVYFFGAGVVNYHLLVRKKN